MRQPRRGVAIVLAALFAAAGCASDGEWSVRKMLGMNDPLAPSMDNFPKPDLAIAKRVDDVGNKILHLNTFLSIEPLFHTIGVPENVLFHRGPQELFISEGLVKQCKTEDELAAVLCSELGRMIVEKTAARRVAADRDTIPDAALPNCGPPMTGGGTPYDCGRQAELAMEERRQKAAPPIDPERASQKAQMLLRTAGFDPAVLDQVQPLLKQSDRGVLIRKQMSGSAPAPTWTP